MRRSSSLSPRSARGRVEIDEQPGSFDAIPVLGSSERFAVSVHIFDNTLTARGFFGVHSYVATVSVRDGAFLHRGRVCQKEDPPLLRASKRRFVKVSSRGASPFEEVS